MLAVVLMFSVARAVYYDGNNDGWIIIPTAGECAELSRTGMPVDCVDHSLDCPRCGADANGNRVWCNFVPNCTVTTWNYAVYLTTIGQCCQTPEHNHDDRYYTKTETDNIVTGLNNRITTVETSITRMLNRIAQLEDYVNMIICKLLPKILVKIKGVTCPVY